MNRLLKCPWCECVFVTKEDLALHLGAYGNYSHKVNLKFIHLSIDGKKPKTWWACEADNF